jgi:hypothetical protein
MGSIGKNLALTLILIVCLTIVGTSSAQTIPKPSVPEFTVKYIDSSYDVPTTTSIDQYTGKKVTNEGYHIENKSIELTIRNQPFAPYMQNGQVYISLFYNVREKGHFAQNWTEIYNAGRGYLLHDNGSYTIVSYSLTQNEFPFWNHVTDGGTIDFQVQTLIGYTYVEHYSKDGQFLPNPGYYFEGQTSDWSNIQTVSIPDGSVSVFTSPTPTPSVPEFSWLAVLPLLFSMFLITVILRRRKTISQNKLNVYRKKHKLNFK